MSASSKTRRARSDGVAALSAEELKSALRAQEERARAACVAEIQEILNASTGVTLSVELRVSGDRIAYVPIYIGGAAQAQKAIARKVEAVLKKHRCRLAVAPPTVMVDILR